MAPLPVATSRTRIPGRCGVLDERRPYDAKTWDRLIIGGGGTIKKGRCVILIITAIPLQAPGSVELALVAEHQILMRSNCSSVRYIAERVTINRQVSAGASQKRHSA